jgi:hypothetical protein
MAKKKAILVGVVATSTLYLGFAVTTPTVKPNEPLSTRQKIAKDIKPKFIDKALDKLRDEATNIIMYEGAKWIGGPFRGGDEDATRETVEIVIDPREWTTSVFKIAAKVSKPAKTASPIDDTPGADPATQSSHLPFTNQTNQQPDAPTKTDTSSHATQSPDREFVREHTEGPVGRGDVPVSTPSTGTATNAPQSAPTNQGQAIELKAGEQSMQQAQQGDLVRGPDGSFHLVPKETAPTAPVASSSPAPAAPAPAAPAPAQPRTTGGGPSGDRGPMGGAHEINRGVDKPDGHTPGTRDVSGIS